MNGCARTALAAALIGASAVLLFSTGPVSRAATATQTQATAAAVKQTISWGSAGACTQSMGTADFGSLDAGSSAESTTFRGCVASNATWSVSAVGTAALTNAGDASTIDNANLVVRAIGTALPSGATTSCGDTNTTCTLDASRTVLSGASKNGKAFDYKYQLTVPSTASGGTYTGGEVTFTASN